jgi:hypothetical protein
MAVMCGRVRLSSDYSEIKIKLVFDAAAPAAVGNVKNTGPQLAMPV